MCLIAFAWHAHPRYAFALIANRDEYHPRPAAAAAPDADDPRIVGGRDLQAGGSWLQLSTTGRFAAVTNVRAGGAEAGKPRSRGELVGGFVRASDRSAAFAGALTPYAGDYGRFNLLSLDGDALRYTGNHPQFHDGGVDAGLHGLSNGALDDDWPKVRHARHALETWLETSDALHPDTSPLFDALHDETIAADDALPDTGVGLALERMLSPSFIRGPRYGTRCSTVVLIGHDGTLALHERSYGPDGIDLGTRRWQAARGDPTWTAIDE